MHKLIGIATAVVATAAVALVHPGIAAATQGPHHHPTAVGSVHISDQLVTVYRDTPDGRPGTYRWCVTNYHHVGDVIHAQLSVGIWPPLEFPHGGGHTTCTDLYRSGTSTDIHVSYEAEVDYALDLDYRP